MREADFLILEPVSLGKIGQSLWQVAFGLFLQRLDDMFAQLRLNRPVVDFRTRWKRHDDLLSPDGDFRIGSGYDRQRMALANAHARFVHDRFGWCQ